MLRVKSKEEIIEILNGVRILCEKGISKDDATLLFVLQEAQNAVISAGEQLEKEAEDISEIISMMEQLCETFYLLSVDMKSRKKYAAQISKSLKQIVSAVSNLPAGYRVVFFPYKADMWDSLESVWLACKDDPLCDCKVVPIPYYHCNANAKRWEYRYEIDQFPKYVPITNYKDYDLTEGADTAFIHNPYDEYNYVTNVHSDYFSYNLKKYVETLFYIPYYVTTGFIADDHKMLSAYMNADYLVVQSEAFKEGLKGYPYYDKALVFGSPKLDRIIRLSENKEIEFDEWKDILAGKKTLMLNTSINQFLYDAEAYLKKLKYLFDVVKDYEDVVIIWRPHPLLQYTIESMRPNLLDRYMELKDYFVNENIGIFDTTPDIINTVAVTDGYIGENSSSVVNLFEAAGKPLFILNNYILEDIQVKDKGQLLLTDCQKVGEHIYCTSAEDSNIYEVEASDWGAIRKKTKINNAPRWLPAGARSASVGNEVYYVPSWSEEFFAYDTKENTIKEISSIKGKKTLFYRYVISYKEKLFYLPNITKKIVAYDVKTGDWKEYAEPIIALQENVNERIFEDICGYAVKDNEIWMTTLYSNRVLCFDMETGDYQIYKIGDDNNCYSVATITDKTLYLSNAETGAILIWDIETKQIEGEYIMPDNYKTYRNVQGRYVAHRDLFATNAYLFATPSTANGMVCVDVKTGKSKVVAEEFWSDVFEAANNYQYEVHGIASFAKMIDENTLLVQKRRDASLLELNVHTGEYKIHHPKLAPGELEKMLEGEDGFEKSYTNGEFARRESKYFSFEEFLDDLVNDRLGDAMKRQKKEMETMAVNLDGTCGEKVHEFMMKVLTQK